MTARLRPLLIALIATVAVSASAADRAPTLTAQLTCQRAAGPGRILCELITQARTGKLVWSDALVVRAPGFARPLRSRFVAQLDPTGAPKASAKLALVATVAGQGKLELLARGVVCGGEANAESCAPEVCPVTVLIEVGPSVAKVAPSP